MLGEEQKERKKGIWKEILTYFTVKEVHNVDVVTITFRDKNILGLVTSVEDVSGGKMNIKDMAFNLKKVIDVKEGSIFKKEYLESALLTGNYFSLNKNAATASLIPNVFIEHYDKISLSIKNHSVAKDDSKQEGVKLKAEKLLLQVPLKDRISIYKTLVRENFAAKKSVFLVLPTERDIKIFTDSLVKGIEQFTFSFHSKLSTKKTLTRIGEAVNTVHPVLILGTAPFLIIPRCDIGVIIL